jgi:hypothetical protein
MKWEGVFYMMSSTFVRKTRLRITAAIVGCGISAFALVASAEMYYPASACHAESPTSLDRLDYNSGSVYNGSSSGDASVVCPISYDSTTNAPSTDLWYVDNSSATYLTCTHNWNEFDGDPYWSWTLDSSGLSSSLSARKFEIDDPETTVYFKNWRCTLPTSSSVKVTGYYYAE